VKWSRNANLVKPCLVEIIILEDRVLLQTHAPTDSCLNRPRFLIQREGLAGIQKIGASSENMEIGTLVVSNKDAKTLVLVGIKRVQERE